KAEQIVALFPNAAVSATYNRTLKKQVMTMDFMGSPMEIEVGTDNNYSGGINFGMPIINAALWNSIQLSQIGVETALEAARASKLDLVYEVKKAFYTMLLAKETYEVLEKNYQTVSLTYENILNKYQVGMASEFDKLRAEVQLKNQKPALISSKNNYDLSIMMLKVMIGLNVDEAVIFEGKMAEYEDLVENATLPLIDSLSVIENTHLKQLELAERQLKKTKDIIISNACPSLNLSRSYQYMSMNNDFKFNDYRWNPYSVVGLTLSIPIVSWAGTAYQIKSSKLAIQNIQDQRLALERNITISVSNSLNNMRNAIEQLTSNKETMLQAEKAYDISLKQYEIGMGTWLDLQSSEMMLINSKLTYSQSIYSYLAAYAELEKTLGNEYIK
ncbi:MAG: TolC family protein, partial [Bacteroidales bacterium]|nr:TolC family protein [Bacteroidales bacterium]